MLSIFKVHDVLSVIINFLRARVRTRPFMWCYS